MLARLDRIEGVERSSANRSGTLIRLDLAPGADRERVAEAATRALGRKGEERPTRLSQEAATEAAQSEEWRDAGRIAELSGIEARTLLLRALVVVVLGGAAIGGALWWRRRRRARTGATSGPGLTNPGP